MNPILSAGILIGVLCGVWTFVMGFTGWYKDPTLLNAFFLVIVFEIGGLIWGLRKTAAEGRTYLGQIVAGTLMAVVAGVIVICSSLLFTTVAFPNYFAELETINRQLLQSQGKSAAEIEEAVRATASTATPMGQAMAGFIGTLLTGIIASAVIAIFVRRK
jgi:TM2 domain-containing membrane protein YozV